MREPSGVTALPAPNSGGDICLRHDPGLRSLHSLTLGYQPAAPLGLLSKHRVSPNRMLTASMRLPDKGLVSILDNRILTKRYGRLFLDALPEAPVEIVEK